MPSVLLPTTIPGLSPEVAMRVGINSQFWQTEWENESDEAYRLIRLCDGLATQSSLSYLALGLILHEIERRELWKGTTNDFRELRQQMGLDGSEWSRLKKVIDVLVIGLRIPDAVLGRITDRTKLYLLAQRTGQMLKKVGHGGIVMTPEGKQETIEVVTLDLASQAQEMSRLDFDALLSQKTFPDQPQCLERETKTICRRSGVILVGGEADPDCPFCQGTCAGNIIDADSPLALDGQALDKQ